MIPKKIILIAAVKIALLVLAAAVLFSIYGCNTVRGIGQDIEKAGETIQKSTK